MGHLPIPKTALPGPHLRRRNPSGVIEPRLGNSTTYCPNQVTAASERRSIKHANRQQVLTGLYPAKQNL